MLLIRNLVNYAVATQKAVAMNTQVNLFIRTKLEQMCKGQSMVPRLGEALFYKLVQYWQIVARKIP